MINNNFKSHTALDKTTSEKRNSTDKITMAFVYDLDGTLVDGYLYNQCFEQLLNINLMDEWPNIIQKSIEFDAIPNLYFTYKLVDALKRISLESGKTFTQIYDECVKNVKYFNGVESWFSNINNFAKQQGVDVQHYIVSAGDKELMSRISISPQIQKIYGNTFIYENGVPIWPANTITSVEKTEYVYRISKGKFNAYDASIYEKTNIEQRNVPFKNIVYFGDGETDVPSMKLVKNKGGHSIAVYGANKQGIAQKLLADNRVTSIAPADYSIGSELYNYVCSIIVETASNAHK